MHGPSCLRLIFVLAACTPRVSPEEFKTLRAEFNTRNQVAYEAALARAGLEPVPAPGKLQTYDGAGPGAPDNVYVVGTWTDIDPEGPLGADFARDAQGQLWHVQRRPKVEEPDSVIVKACYPNYMGSVAPVVYQVGYELPEGVNIAGVKSIEYPAETISPNYKDGPCDKGPPRP